MEVSEEDIEHYGQALALMNGQPFAANKLATELCRKYGLETNGHVDPLSWLLACTLICERFQKITGREARID